MENVCMKECGFYHSCGGGIDFCEHPKRTSVNTMIRLLQTCPHDIGFDIKQRKPPPITSQFDDEDIIWAGKMKAGADLITFTINKDGDLKQDSRHMDPFGSWVRKLAKDFALQRNYLEGVERDRDKREGEVMELAGKLDRMRDAVDKLKEMC
jgi:hypothetical protein